MLVLCKIVAASVVWTLVTSQAKWVKLPVKMAQRVCPLLPSRADRRSGQQISTTLGPHDARRPIIIVMDSENCPVRNSRLIGPDFLADKWRSEVLTIQDTTDLSKIHRDYDFVFILLAQQTNSAAVWKHAVAYAGPFHLYTEVNFSASTRLNNCKVVYIKCFKF